MWASVPEEREGIRPLVRTPDPGRGLVCSSLQRKAGLIPDRSTAVVGGPRAGQCTPRLRDTTGQPVESCPAPTSAGSSLRLIPVTWMRPAEVPGDQAEVDVHALNATAVQRGHRRRMPVSRGRASTPRGWCSSGEGWCALVAAAAAQGRRRGGGVKSQPSGCPSLMPGLRVMVQRCLWTRVWWALQIRSMLDGSVSPSSIHSRTWWASQRPGSTRQPGNTQCWSRMARALRSRRGCGAAGAADVEDLAGRVVQPRRSRRPRWWSASPDRRGGSGSW